MWDGVTKRVARFVMTSWSITKLLTGWDFLTGISMGFTDNCSKH